MNTKIISFLTLSILFMFSGMRLYANEPDSAFIFAYSTEKNTNRNGLHFAWSIDKKKWYGIGNEFGFLRSDYGRWGAEKRMINPVVHQGKDGVWHALWTLNEQDGAFAYASSKDLISWMPQAYPLVSEGKNCLLIEVSPINEQYSISWGSANGNDTTYYAVATRDFNIFSETKNISKSQRINQRKTVLVDNELQTGSIHRVPWKVIDELEKRVVWANYRNQLFEETTQGDPIRFAGLKPTDATITIDANDTKKISDMFLGIFFEDISYAADGGIYAELIRNRDFEFSEADHRDWNAKTAWSSSVENDNAKFYIDTINPVHPNNPHYANLLLSRPVEDFILKNEGFDGIPLKKGEKYDFSFFAAVSAGNKKSDITIQLATKTGNIVAEKIISPNDDKWRKYSTVLTASESVNDAVLKVKITEPGRYKLDMISLFPQKTFRNRKNGLRADLAQTLADMKPRFVRFPGGCVAHGDGINNIYHWKNTVGTLEARKPQRNIWGYHQTAGLGYFEYFQFCEDIDAEPIPIIAAGVPCQNSGHHGCALGGQQGGIPLEEMDDYIRDIFDLIEWANGDPKKNKWARMRAEAGHPEPFNLKYIGVGNEDLISHVFEERFEMIYNAIKEKYPEIVIIGTVGPFSEGSDYVRGWEFATELGLPIVDEHYYQPPGWFIYNQDYYDRYDRNKSKVYLGEYAAHLPGRPNNIETALAEAMHLINCERNGDIVEMTSYAPLLAKEKFTQWNPDLIYFSNTEVKPTVGYYVQQLFGEHTGTTYLSTELNVMSDNEKVRKRIACSAVKDEKSGDLIIKLVNLLPEKINTNLIINGIDPTVNKVKEIVLSGKPDDRSARPIEKNILQTDIRSHELPPYSLTILRISK